MSDNNKDSAVCPNCPRHCPSDQLSCDRGRRYFGLETSGDEGHHGEGHRGHKEHHGGPRFIESDSRNPLIQNLLKASAVAEHKSQMMRIHGQDESSLFSVLTDEEQKELSSLRISFYLNGRKAMRPITWAGTEISPKACFPMGDRPLKSPPRRVDTLFLSFPASYGSKLDSQCHKEIES